MAERESAGCAFSLGSLIAAVLSYAKWHSVLWAILHLFLGWIYVIYYLIKYGLPSE